MAAVDPICFEVIRNALVAATDEMAAIARRVRPDVITLVPERREERTTEGGLDVVGARAQVEKIAAMCREVGIKLSLFIAPDFEQIAASRALEAATRYIARDLGPKGIRVNAISAGAMRTLSLAGISGGRGLLSQGRMFSALKEDTSMEGVAGCALWLASDLGKSTTGEVVHVDAGFHMMGMPDPEEA